MGNTVSNSALFTAILGAALTYAIYSKFSTKKGANKSLHKKNITNESLSIYNKSNKPVYVTNPDETTEIKYSKTGVASMKAKTLIETFKKAVQMHSSHPALRYQVDGKWKDITYKQYYEGCMKVARSLVALGMEVNQSVNIIGFNSYQWFFGNMGAIFAGGKCAGIYTTNLSAASRYIVEHSDGAVVLVEDEKQLAKFLDFKDEVKTLKAIVQWSGTIPEHVKNSKSRVPVLTWDEFLAAGENEKEKNDIEVAKRMHNITPGTCASLIYTSGTTGNPKAVMISHDNINFTVNSSLNSLNNYGRVAPEERLVSYLPLSHIAAQLLDVYIPIVTTAEGQFPTTVYFARPDALKGTLKDTLVDVQPTAFFGVPRVWEKMQEAMIAKGKNGSFIVKQLGSFAKSIGGEYYANSQIGGSGDKPAMFDIVDSIVFKKVHAALGFLKCRNFFTGAAPISLDTLKYFGSLNIHVMELYGMSELTGPCTFCKHHYFKAGSIGAAIDGVEIKIDHVDGRDKAGEGEICIRSRGNMMGYMKEPLKTRETIDDEGFLHSGDVGRVDEDGLYYITGRIKELIITAGGENVAPVPIEDEIKGFLPAVSNAIVIGDRRKFLSVLLTLKTDTDQSGDKSSGKLVGAASEVCAAKTVEEAIKSKEFNDYLQKGIDKYNKGAVSAAQKVSKFCVLKEEFTIGGGELTSTLKVKRNIVNQKHAASIESIYAGSQE